MPHCHQCNRVLTDEEKAKYIPDCKYMECNDCDVLHLHTEIAALKAEIERLKKRGNQ